MGIQQTAKFAVEQAEFFDCSENTVIPNCRD
jgi:hypothetical protein